MAVKPSISGAMNSSTPITTLVHSPACARGLDRIYNPTIASNTPPIHATLEPAAAPNANGAMNNRISITTVSQILPALPRS